MNDTKNPVALQAQGLPVRIDLPGVGQGLQDHLLVRVEHRALGGVTLDQAVRFENRMSELSRSEVSTGVEIFIARESQRAPRRYVCYQRLNTRPNAHQVRKLIVMESRAALCASGLPADAALTKLLTPFS